MPNLLNANWIVMPVMAGPEMTLDAISDCLAQSVPTKILIVNQGVDTAFRQQLERLAEEYPEQIFLWSHEPTLLSLSATWNRALDFVWQIGGAEALVINNDVRLRPATLEWLIKILHLYKALFVTAVAVTKEQYDSAEGLIFPVDPDAELPVLSKGGPDFSCYLISKACHEQFRFDEQFIPAYCEDLDYHRRLMLAGLGDKIFSVNLPYLHLAAGTLKTLDAPARMRVDRLIESGSRAHYRAKWGGPVNQETFYVPFDQPHTTSLMFNGPGPTTPEIQAFMRDHHELTNG
jgi:hypothetical protein